MMDDKTNESEKSFQSCEEEIEGSEKSFRSCNGKGDLVLESDDDDDIKIGACRENASDEDISSWDENDEEGQWIYENEAMEEVGKCITEKVVSEEALKDLESIMENHLTIDEKVKSNKADKNDPTVIPTSGRYFMHDDREESGVNEEQKSVKKLTKKWDHDLFDEREQQPLSSNEIVFKYGYDIRDAALQTDEVQRPPRGGRRKRDNRRRRPYQERQRDPEVEVDNVQTAIPVARRQPFSRGDRHRRGGRRGGRAACEPEWDVSPSGMGDIVLGAEMPPISEEEMRMHHIRHQGGNVRNKKRGGGVDFCWSSRPVPSGFQDEEQDMEWHNSSRVRGRRRPTRQILREDSHSTDQCRQGEWRGGHQRRLSNEAMSPDRQSANIEKESNDALLEPYGDEGLWEQQQHRQSSLEKKDPLDHRDECCKSQQRQGGSKSNIHQEEYREELDHQRRQGGPRRDGRQRDYRDELDHQRRQRGPRRGRHQGDNYEEPDVQQQRQRGGARKYMHQGDNYEELDLQQQRQRGPKEDRHQKFNEERWDGRPQSLMRKQERHKEDWRQGNKNWVHRRYNDSREERQEFYDDELVQQQASHKEERHHEYKDGDWEQQQRRPRDEKRYDGRWEEKPRRQTATNVAQPPKRYSQMRGSTETTTHEVLQPYPVTGSSYYPASQSDASLYIDPTGQYFYPQPQHTSPQYLQPVFYPQQQQSHNTTDPSTAAHVRPVLGRT